MPVRSIFDFETTAEIDPLDEVIGRERAVRAITFGLEMKSVGYNIFITGPEGTGKTTIVQDIVRKTVRDLPTPPDWCMVDNFKNEYQPRTIPLKPGQGIRFSKSIQCLVNDLKIRFPKAFEAEPFREKIVEIQKRFGELKKEKFETLDRSAKEKQLKVEKTPFGYQTIPMGGEKPYSQEGK